MTDKIKPSAEDEEAASQLLGWFGPPTFDPEDYEMTVQIIAQARAEGARKEREQIVAWLREEDYSVTANAIERGLHEDSK